MHFRRQQVLQAAFDKLKQQLTKDAVAYGGWLLEGGKEEEATRDLKCKLVDNIKQFILDGRKHGDDDKLWRQYQLLLAQAMCNLDINKAELMRITGINRRAIDKASQRRDTFDVLIEVLDGEEAEENPQAIEGVANNNDINMRFFQAEQRGENRNLIQRSVIRAWSRTCSQELIRIDTCHRQILVVDDNGIAQYQPYRVLMVTPSQLLAHFLKSEVWTAYVVSHTYQGRCKSADGVWSVKAMVPTIGLTTFMEGLCASIGSLIEQEDCANKLSVGMIKFLEAIERIKRQYPDFMKDYDTKSLATFLVDLLCAYNNVTELGIAGSTVTPAMYHAVQEVNKLAVEKKMMAKKKARLTAAPTPSVKQSSQVGRVKEALPHNIATTDFPCPQRPCMYGTCNNPNCGVAGLRAALLQMHAIGLCPPQATEFSLDLYVPFTKHGSVQYELDRQQKTCEEIEHDLLALLCSFLPHKFLAIVSDQVYQRFLYQLPMFVLFYTVDYGAMFTLTKQHRLNQANGEHITQLVFVVTRRLRNGRRWTTVCHVWVDKLLGKDNRIVQMGEERILYIISKKDDMDIRGAVCASDAPLSEMKSKYAVGQTFMKVNELSRDQNPHMIAPLRLVYQQEAAAGPAAAAAGGAAFDPPVASPRVYPAGIA